MTVTEERSDRIARRGVDKFEERRRELATGALLTLAERGYARTSLREIAQNTEFSHGTLHYYFRDKTELITYCVREYKARCVLRYDAIVADATTAAGLADAFAAGLAQTLREDAPLHRLWYDLRSQSLFEDAFRADVTEIDDSLQRMIARVVDRYAELAGRPVAVPPGTAYALFDGLFLRALHGLLRGAPDAVDELVAGARFLLAGLV